MKALSLKTIGLALALTVCAASAAFADVKITTKASTSVAPTASSTTTVYIKGARQRSESVGGDGASILQCDLKRNIQLNDREKTYTAFSWRDEAAAAASAASTSAQTTGDASQGATRRGGVINYTTTTTDLRETKVMFGLTARHFRTEIVIESSPDACTPVKQRIITDGWYANLNVGLNCFQDYGMAIARKYSKPDCKDRYVQKNIGPARPGYPLLETTTFEMSGQSYTSTSEVIELSNAPLSAALFDVPAGYTEVKEGVSSTSADAAKALAEAQAEAAAADSEDVSSSANSRPQNAASTVGSADSATLGAKRAGVLRIGVPMPYATAAEGMSTSALAQVVQSSLLTTMKSPAVEVIALEARVPSQIEAEAREKECDFILYTNVAHKKGGGGGLGGFLRKAAPVVDAVPMGSGTSAVVADVATQTAIYTAASIATSVKAKDEINLDYRLMATGNNTTPVTSRTLKGKARSDGEDVLTPLVQQEASAVLAAATNR